MGIANNKRQVDHTLLVLKVNLIFYYMLYPFGFWLCHLQESSHISSIPFSALHPKSSLACFGSA